MPVRPVSLHHRAITVKLTIIINALCERLNKPLSCIRSATFRSETVRSVFLPFVFGRCAAGALFYSSFVVSSTNKRLGHVGGGAVRTCSFYIFYSQTHLFHFHKDKSKQPLFNQGSAVASRNKIWIIH